MEDQRCNSSTCWRRTGLIWVMLCATICMGKPGLHVSPRYDPPTALCQHQWVCTHHFQQLSWAARDRLENSVCESLALSLLQGLWQGRWHDGNTRLLWLLSHFSIDLHHSSCRSLRKSRESSWELYQLEAVEMIGWVQAGKNNNKPAPWEISKRGKKEVWNLQMERKSQFHS